MSPSIPVTYGDLISLLIHLGFQDESVEGSHVALRHRTSESLVLLADVKSEEPVRWEDLISVRRHLDSKGLMDANAFDRRFPQPAAADG